MRAFFGITGRSFHTGLLDCVLLFVPPLVTFPLAVPVFFIVVGLPLGQVFFRRFFFRVFLFLTSVGSVVCAALCRFSRSWALVSFPAFFCN